MKLLNVTFYKLKMMLGDRLFFTAMIIIPLFITLASGYALRQEKLGTVPIAFVDEDLSSYSAQLIGRMGRKEGLKVLSVQRDEALSLLEGGKVEQVFVIKAGFEERIKSGESRGLIDVVNSPSSYSAGYTGEVTAGEVIRLVTDNMAADWVATQYKKLGKPAGEALRQEAAEYNESLWEPEPLMTIDYRELEGGMVKEASKAAAVPAATASSAGLITAFMMFYVLFSSGWLVEERTNGTVKRLAAGPGALYLSFAGSVIALLISGALQIVLFTAVDRLISGVSLFPGMLSYLVFFTYLAAVISISLFLSSILKTQAQLQTGAPVLALVTGFAGGCFWNFVEMPENIRKLSLFTPQGWALEGINKLLSNPGDLSAVLLPTLVLFAVSLILLPLSYIIINMQLKY